MTWSDGPGRGAEPAPNRQLRPHSSTASRSASSRTPATLLAGSARLGGSRAPPSRAVHDVSVGHGSANAEHKRARAEKMLTAATCSFIPSSCLWAAANTCHDWISQNAAVC
eukprot:2355990-Rhodomonas_salina.2